MNEIQRSTALRRRAHPRSVVFETVPIDVHQPRMMTPAPFVARDPYRPLEPGQQRVAFYEPSYVRGRKA